MNKIFIFLLFSIFLCGCDASKKILYLQNLQANTSNPISGKNDIIIQPRDMLSIVVSSKDPELSALFNLPRITYEAGLAQTNANNNRISGYTVDAEGNIDFPNLGIVHIAGLTRNQVAELIKKKLSEEELLKDAVVTVDYMNLCYSVMGEVTHPGNFSINRDQITVLEALSKAGDLTIYGQRDRVFVIREENGQRNTYQLDLRSVSLFDSPAYYIQQNDLVYVEPNKVRAGQSTINANNVKSVSLWTSIASLLTSISVLIFK